MVFGHGIHVSQADRFLWLLLYTWWSSKCIVGGGNCWITKSCPTLCNPVDYSTPGSSVLHSLPEFAQIPVHWVSDAIKIVLHTHSWECPHHKDHHPGSLTGCSTVPSCWAVFPHSRQKSKITASVEFLFPEEHIGLPAGRGPFQLCMSALLSPLQLSSAHWFPHAPVFNWCCQKGYPANVLNVFGKGSYGLRLLPDSIFALAWFENVCWPSVWNWLGGTGKLALPLRQEWSPLFMEGKWQRTKLGCGQTQIELLGAIAFCICTVIGFPQGWTETFYFCYIRSRCLSLCV